MRRGVLFAVCSVFLSMPSQSLLEELSDQLLETRAWLAGGPQPSWIDSCIRLALLSNAAGRRKMWTCNLLDLQSLTTELLLSFIYCPQKTIWGAVVKIYVNSIRLRRESLVVDRNTLGSRQGFEVGVLAYKTFSLVFLYLWKLWIWSHYRQLHSTGIPVVLLLL